MRETNANQINPSAHITAHGTKQEQKKVLWIVSKYKW
jgi:hypothetical protein